jgi:hypothetical protein
MLRSLRQLGDNVEKLRDRVGPPAHHRNSAENSEGIAVSCPQGDVRAGDPQLPKDVQNLHTGLSCLHLEDSLCTQCLLSLLYRMSAAQFGKVCSCE